VIELDKIGVIDYEVKDFVALTPHNEAHFCLVPRIVDQQIILKLQKVMMDIGNANVRNGVCDEYYTVMKFVNDHPVVEIHLTKENDMTKTNPEFQAWIQSTWMEHLDEKLTWKETVDYTQSEWLKDNMEFLTNKFQEVRELPPELKQRARAIDGFGE
jgi:hypothetical protein|tara:strand:+ start:315 stop:785 length:471 start_codon:yes stop_codon:yes gene_type:complete